MAKLAFQPQDMTFTKAADIYLSEVRKGTAPSIEDFARAFPHLADSIYREFHSILMLEDALRHNIPEEPPKLPKEIGGCKLEAELGRGAMGVVYRAYQPSLARPVAVKVIPLQDVNANASVARFEIESRAMAALEHPNIVPVYSSGCESGYGYLIMKFIEGRSLDQLLYGEASYRSQILLANLRSDWDAFAQFGSQVAAGLQHAHDRGLIHRDVKPANLLLDNNGKIWITDFGLAKMTSYAMSLSGTGDAIGTPRYMAPEQLRGQCDARSDIYSLGITLYELAAGERVWNSETYETLTRGRSGLQLPQIQSRNSDIPRDLAKIIMKACEFDPERRYQNAEELRFVLERLAHGIKPGDRRGPRRLTDDEYRRRARRTMNLAFAGIGVCVALAPIGVVLINKLRLSMPTPQIAVAATSPGSISGDPATVAASSSQNSVPSNSPLNNESTAERMQQQIRPNYLERLAGIESGNPEEEVADYFRKTVAESAGEFHLSEPEKQQLVGQVDRLLNQMRDRNYTKEDMKSFLTGYRGTILPLATRMISYVRVVEHSRLFPNEKAEAFVILRRFAKAVVNRYIPEDDALLLETILTQGKRYTINDIVNADIPPEVLRHWLGALHQRTAVLNMDLDRAPIRLEPELERAIQFADQKRNAGQ
ncbi:MAG: serine/threonine-protein kinase [Pirellulales bacterium]